MRKMREDGEENALEKKFKREQWSRIELSVQNDSKFSMAESIKICSDEWERNFCKRTWSVSQMSLISTQGGIGRVISGSG